VCFANLDGSLKVQNLNVRMYRRERGRERERGEVVANG